MPELRLEDTIAAIATAPGEGGIAVIRVSGPDAFRIASKVFYPHKGSINDFVSHTIHMGEVRENGQAVDQALISIFRAPHSYTGEEVLEISSHGGLLVTRKILNLLVKNGARHAEPGEFTKRAFLNGKIDLAQAEAVLDLIKAKSDRSLETALRQLAGSLSQKFKSIKDRLMKIYAHLEAFLDFPEEDLEIYSDAQFLKNFTDMEAELGALAASFERGSVFREGVRVALVGRPNAGKSSLFNVLLSRDRALVSEYPGTTRDVLEEAIELGGVYVRLLDTAGLASDMQHPLDKMGMEKTKSLLKEADFYLYVADGSSVFNSAEEELAKEINSIKPVLGILNKSDLGLKIQKEKIQKLFPAAEFIPVSTKTREGIDALEKKLSALILKGKPETEGEQVTRLRHKNALEQALAAMKRAREKFQKQESLEVVVLEVKSALDSMRELLGEVYSEDLLDVIFSEFCIGK